jgi:hypothetical protein
MSGRQLGQPVLLEKFGFIDMTNSISRFLRPSHDISICRGSVDGIVYVPVRPPEAVNVVNTSQKPDYQL